MTYTYPCIEYVGPAYPDASAPASARALASRVSDGIEVDLWWEPGRVVGRCYGHQDRRGVRGSGWR
jgi:hypothetical protein